MSSILGNYHMALAIKPTIIRLSTSPLAPPTPKSPSRQNQQSPSNSPTSNVSVLVEKGNALFNQGNHTQAIQYHDKALA
ncbi:MAG: hypothetical protein JO297_06475 [Nitrososphaeraceae archaeon]|nr:hypothetical protein [Nitrososphaeraceae archaeon]